jgi:hypothetical protein
VVARQPTAPASLEVDRANRRYAFDEEYLYALAEAPREEHGGSWHGPHAYDIELAQLVDILLEVKAHDVVEHPELVAQRIVRHAEAVGS